MHDGRVTDGEGLDVAVPEGQLKVLKAQGYDQKKMNVGIRREDMNAEQIAHEARSDSRGKTKDVVSEFLGAESMLYCTAGKSKFTAHLKTNLIYVTRDLHEAVSLPDQMCIRNRR
ncbi:hypothetical protein WP50_18890 [Lactiplantibacillus plantarum]|nr:hypothetical protein WP50_18890 [Lactiplantibacillus plantarum]